MRLSMRQFHVALATFSLLFVIGPVSAADHRDGLRNLSRNSGLFLMGPGENLELAFQADCTVPQPKTDRSTVLLPRADRSVTFNLNFRDPAGLVADYTETIMLSDGEVETRIVETAVWGPLVSVSFSDVSGQGACLLNSAGRRTDGSGKTINLFGGNSNLVQPDGSDAVSSKQSPLVLMGPNEILELAFLATCSAPDSENTVVLNYGKIEFEYRAQGLSGAAGEFVKSIELFDGDVEVIKLDSAVLGSLVQLRASDSGSRGACELDLAVRLADDAGRTLVPGDEDTLYLYISSYGPG